ncbi:site-specific integrase [Domibacillus mangrovi]|uniref:Site-specific integrase n=1 Tax=Domibacillus mangrovi TaxID=1714354 RepID=A0A1Q5NZQ1_9BACI|nr:site-specific integrase [Domibacillus mangrovi]OKL35332.1 site-specific integrase [Domibacillus mangrovi]
MEIVQPIKDKQKIEAMKKVLRASTLRNELLFVLGINTGLRISDLLSLRIKDVWTNNKVAVRIELKEKKTGKMRHVALNNKTRQLIKQYIEKERKKSEGTESLFLSQKGGAISRQHAYEILNQAAKWVGVTDRIGTHSLRKTFGYFAYQQGVDLAMIQKLLNHSSQAETLRYIGITQEQMDDVVMKLEL